MVNPDGTRPEEGHLDTTDVRVLLCALYVPLLHCNTVTMPIRMPAGAWVYGAACKWALST